MDNKNKDKDKSVKATLQVVTLTTLFNTLNSVFWRIQLQPNPRQTSLFPSIIPPKVRNQQVEQAVT